ncbi:PX domain-containing protein YPT35 [Suhomyces tanzawaensis NRRL Y-17324]|uniref:Endosomal/vacuolar adapter protein YPT35 n=1 Tax=Suhomyces tanzawaensis NRRL Y-17324 TaxID=984487 RepID=A0A1E4SGU3_9ASCO|nr:PX domain-containing protein YPT35 [Suhomyces tanzawaensis NRRL Y-17324]ODV78632.1 PX domain-containing protein YPT35 [Suhomyces tanzawaensis NRRL Y-17324]
MDRRNTLSQLNRVLPVPIQLHGDESGDESHSSSHITNVMVGDHHVVEGQGGPSFTVWSIKVMLDESEYTSIELYKRYLDIERFQYQLKTEFAAYNYNIPELPPKDSFSLERMTMSRRWLEERRRGLQWFLRNVLLNPMFQRSQAVREFITR